MFLLECAKIISKSRNILEYGQDLRNLLGFAEDSMHMYQYMHIGT